MAEETKKPSSAKKAGKKKTGKSWWKGLRAEYDKIVWTDRKDLGKQTVAVVSISAIVCILITLIDSLGLQLMQLIIK